jgi:hypothetical protein
MQGETNMGKMRFLEYSFMLNNDDSIKFEELDAEKLNVKPGDGFMAFIDPATKELTLRKVDLNNIEYITAEI